MEQELLHILEVALYGLKSSHDIHVLFIGDYRVQQELIAPVVPSAFISLAQT